MLQKRLIPILLLHKGGLYKTKNFMKPVYVGDPINAIKIFNEKEVDELIFLDIDASKKGEGPNYDVIKAIASECFMPLCYGGGVNDFEQADKLFRLGVEKISLNSILFKNKEIISEISKVYGSQSVVGAMDIKKNILGKYFVYDHVKKKNTKLTPVNYAIELEKLGVGEILINNVHKDGKKSGYELDLIKEISYAVSIPVIACGGAGNIDDCAEILNNTEVSAAGAGSIFVFHGKHDAVLITYPNRELIESKIKI
ncbi:AglZ/HisF2 family acetamidino modification protein [Tenacibaculum ovolyticum]|uniref:AglZ/HisF2 family acetamidino modification protein n=1 Tax=Tenacibaculum ovolyticum TaxID=104270 RepID=UPI003BA87799